MRPNPPIKGHALLDEGRRFFRYVDIDGVEVVEYGCECGRRPTDLLSINGTKRWHREHKAQIRTFGQGGAS